MRAEPDIQAPGTVLAGKYRVERVLGSGGMGVVLAVRHTQLDELYALKLMLPAAAASAPARERFAREAKAAAKLRSEHVARAIDFGFLEDDGPPYMVLELLTGQNLSERLASGGPVEPRSVASWMLQACDALREAHEDGIIHRDLKPSNLFLARRSGDVTSLKVLDFGIAKTIAADAGALTKTATTMGSPFYMSPEQMRSAKNADARSDIWSLGVTMYEMTTGRVPFVGDTVTEVAIAVIECAVESPRVHRPDLPEEFERIVMRCLEKQPARRYASVDHLAEALAAFAGATWSLRPDAHLARLAQSEAPSQPPTVRTDPLAQTEAAASASPASAEKAETIAASPVLTLLGSSSRDGAPGSSAESAPPPGGASTVDPVEKASTSLVSSPPPRPRSRVVPYVMGAGALSVVGLFVLQLSNGSSETRSSGPSEAAAADESVSPAVSAPSLPTSSALALLDASAPTELGFGNDDGDPPPTAASSSGVKFSQTYSTRSAPTPRPTSKPPLKKKSLPKLDVNKAMLPPPRQELNQEDGIKEQTQTSAPRKK